MKECPVCQACFGDHMQICDSDQSLLLDLLPGLPMIEDKYRLDKKIGAGTVGIVFQATMIKTGQDVVIKIISPILSTIDPTLPERFFNIMHAFISLDHSNIIKIYDFGKTSQNILYFVMESLPGITLAEMLKQEAKLPIDTALNIMSKVCEGVTNANRNGVYHLDLKPSNILVYSDEKGQQNAKVLDFGLIRLKNPNLTAKLPPSQRDSVLGKPYYFAPELFTSEGDGRSEVYEIGAILYHLLTGNPPFTGGNYPMLKMQHMGVTPSSLREIRPEVPTTLESIIIKALEKRSAQRHSSVVALAVQLSAQLAKYQEFLRSQTTKKSTTKIPKAEVLSPRKLEPAKVEPTKVDPPAVRKKPVRLGTLIGVNSLPTLPSPPELIYPNTSLASPLAKSNRVNEIDLPKTDNTLPGLPEPPQSFYSDNPTPAPMSTPAELLNSNSMPQVSEPSTPSTTRKKPSRLPSLMGLNTAPTIPSPSESFYSNNQTVEKKGTTTPNLPELTETLPSFPEQPKSLYLNDTNPVSITGTGYSDTDEINDNTEYSALMSESGSFYSASMMAVTTKVNPPPVVDPSTWFTNETDFLEEELLSENIITRSLVSESFSLLDPVETNYGQKPVFEQTDLNETIAKFKISDFVDIPTKEKKVEIQQLSPAGVIYLFSEQFLPSTLLGQQGRQMHNNFITERERLAALLLTVALFSLFSRGVIEITLGSGMQKKQISINQRNEGFIVRAIDLSLAPLDILESKIIDLLKQSNITRFYNIFLHIAQTSVATSEREAICEIVADAIADELTVHKLLQSKKRTRTLESGESAIQYELACDLAPYLNQANTIQSWLQGLQQQDPVELSNRPVQLFIYILKYYTDLFRHNSKELSKT